MTRNLYRTLNNYDYSDQNIEIVKQYLQSNILPSSFSYYKKRRYKLMYKKDFVVENGELIYKPLNLQVIHDKDKEDVLKKLYDDPDQGIGLGIQSFYDKINSQFLNIKRNDVDDFLTSKSLYQIVKPEAKPINKPIVGKYPNHRWAIDLIDMSIYNGHNRKKNWILSGIDYFTKKIFATALTNKKPITTLEGLEKCIHEQMGDTYPKILQADNGGEFKNNTFKLWAKEHDIHLINTKSYTPTGNALVENSNNKIRKMIREFFVRNESFNWVDNLDHIITNRNNSKSTVTKKKPSDLWKPGLDPDDSDEDVQEVYERLKNKAIRDVERSEVQDFQEGDHVRATMASLYSEARKLVKSGRRKLLPVKYSPNIYIVDKTILPVENIDFQKPYYYLRLKSTNEPVLTETKKNEKKDKVHERAHFFGSDLMSVSENQEPVITQHQAVKLNRLGVDAYNEEELENIESKKKQYDVNSKINKKEADEKFKQDLEDNGPRRSKRLNPVVEPKVEPRRSARIKKLQDGNT